MTDTNRTLVFIGLGLAVLLFAILPFLIPWTDGSRLAGWSNYGQTIGGLFAALAFLAVLYTLKLQREQITDSNVHNRQVLERLEGQVSSLRQTAEIHALTAMLQVCERYRTMGVLGDSREMEERAKKAMKQLETMLNLLQAPKTPTSSS